ncbi:hypothetical protein [Sphingomonas sp.]|uniref:hypothetical protein n=1 Tax=Sphingomonas sp. TaxID=28214 RepID=UPI001ECB49F9|nr:hypothetical protein [Sphingomonas sp.]MBX3593003.1 hypothetical protein [Sphingomonas sp.]
MKTATILTALATGSILLAGCGGGGSGSTPATADNGAAPAAVAGGGGATPPAGWNALDACAVIDKAAMAAIVGKSVSETALGMVSESDGTTAATSECTYTLDGGEQATVMLRWSPIADNNEGAINLTRNGLQQTLKAFGGSVETLNGLGKAAFWVDATKSLNVFIGEDKFAIINMPRGPAAKDHGIAVAKRLGA